GKGQILERVKSCSYHSRTISGGSVNQTIMSRLTVDSTNEQGTDWRPQRRWMSGALAQAIVLINGLILTFTAYVVLNMFIQGMMSADLKRLIWETQNRLTEDITTL